MPHGTYAARAAALVEGLDFNLHRVSVPIRGLSNAYLSVIDLMPVEIEGVPVEVRVVEELRAQEDSRAWRPVGETGFA